MKRLLIQVLFIAILLSSISNASESISFSDLNDSHWAYDYIMNLVQSGTLKGYEDGTFKPNKSITRAEAQKILVSEFYPTLYSFWPVSTSDVDRLHWAHDYFSFFYELVEPDANTKNYRPDDPITRAEFSKALCNATKYFSSINYSRKKVEFTDISKGDTNYSEICTLYYNDIISGYEDGSFRPNGLLTRAEVCKMVDISLKKLEQDAVDSMKANNIEYAVYHPELIHTDKYSTIKYKECAKDYMGNILAYTGSTYWDNATSKYITKAQYSLYKNGEKVESFENVKWFGDSVTQTTDGCFYDSLFDVSIKTDFVKREGDTYIKAEDLISALNIYTSNAFHFKYDPREKTFSGRSRVDEYIVGDNFEEEIYISTTIAGINYISEYKLGDVIERLYIEYKWGGPSKEVVEKYKSINTNESLIPPVSNSSFAHLGQAHNNSLDAASLNEVGVNYVDEKSAPVYLKAVRAYKGENAKKCIEEYNKNSDRKYEITNEDNLYVVVFDIDLKDYSTYGLDDEHIIWLEFMHNPIVTAGSLKSDGILMGTTQVLPVESKPFYKTGDMTQMLCVFESEEQLDYSFLKFINENDNSWEIFHIRFN